jgi:hypothetical protein
MKIRLLILALFSALTPALSLSNGLRAASDVPAFNATLTIGKENRFVLVSPAGKASSWLKLGDTFEGYKLKKFDAKEPALELERDGEVTRIVLVSDAATVNASLAPTPATLADAEDLFRVMRFEDMMKKIMDGQKKGM